MYLYPHTILYHSYMHSQCNHYLLAILTFKFQYLEDKYASETEINY